MLKKFLFVFFGTVLGFNLAACGGGSTGETNANANVNGANAVVITNQQQLPEGITTSPLPVSGNTPGIPANATVVNMNSGGTPIPGIDPKKANQPFKPGSTPTPGIPDEETIKKQMKNPPLAPPNSSQSDSPTKQANTPVDSVNKPRTGRTP